MNITQLRPNKAKIISDSVACCSLLLCALLNCFQIFSQAEVFQQMLLKHNEFR